MIHEVFPVGLLGCNCSVLGDETTGEAIVVDPGDQIEDIQAVLARHRLTKVTAIVITHAHIDHIGGAQQLKRLTGAPILMNEKDEMLNRMLDVQAGWLGMATPEQAAVDQSVKDGDTLQLGATELHILHTPGHTQGSICLLVPAENTLIAGDTLFRDSIGRTDLPGGDGQQILRSIHNKLLVLPEDTEVICGHGQKTTIGREKKRNPFLK